MQNIFCFNYLINRMQKTVTKNKSKKFKKSKTIFKVRYFKFQTWVCQNVSNEVLLAWFKFQAKNPNCSGACVQGQWQKYTPPSPLLSIYEGLRDIGHGMSIGNIFWCVNSVTVSDLIHYDSLLQNATVVLQNATGITMRRFLQIKTVQCSTAENQKYLIYDKLSYLIYDF